MKMKFLLAASALLLCLACAREELGTDDRIAGGSNNASEMIFSAVSPSTKTMMGESVEGKRPVYWSEGDKICVNGVVSDPLEGVSENATAVVFRVGSGLDAPFKGLYPASFYTDASTITLPSVQTWENCSFANGSFPMASYTQDQREEMAFRFLCSMLKLSIKQDSSQGVEADEIASVVFRGNDGEQVSGAFTIDYQNATLSSVSSSDNDKIVGMIVNQPLSADKALDIYLVVPARVYDAGFTLSITDAQGRVMKKASNKSQTLKAGIIAKLPEFVFVPNAEGGDDPIPEDLIPKDGDVTEDGEPVVMYFGARIDNGEGDKEGAKTHLGTPADGKYPNLWTVGDKVAINGIASASLPEANIGYDEEEHASTARFPMAQRVDKCAGYYYVGYPYTDGTTSGFTGFSDGAGTVVIPTEQSYTAGTYDPRAFVLIGKSTSQVMSFTPKMALLRVTPTDSDTPYAYNISKVRLESIAGEAMSGTFTTNFEDSFEASSGVSYIEISAPTDDGLDFGTPFFFMIPAQTYTKGLRFIVYTKDGKSMTFSNGSSYTASYGSSRSISSPKYTPSVSGSVSCDFLTSSSAGFSWSGGNASNNVKKPWRLAIYNDEECTSLKVAYNISETGEADGDVWYQQEGTPHYIVGGLTPGTTYYCQVTDVNNNIAMEPISFTTDSFTPIAPSSPVGSVLLAENFGEFGHGSATLGGYSGHRYAGWAPRSTSSISNSVNCAAPTGEVTTGVSLPHDVQLRMVEGFDFTTAPRFYDAGWGFTADALDLEEGDDKETIPSVYSQPGAIRFGKSNNHRIFLVLPALTGISSGKYATVDVTIKASRTVARDISQNNQLAVFLEDDLSMTNTDQRLYSTPSLTRAYPITMTKYGYDSEVNTVRIDGVQNTDHLIIGTYANVNERNRFQIYSVTVTRVSESDVETFDITDDVSLRTFYARVDDGGSGEKSLNAKVLADVTVSSTTISGWTPLDGYTGTLDGQDHSGAKHTITGLTTPFFNELKGTVQNLTLNSTINVTAAADTTQGTAILAKFLKNGTISYCTTRGSVSFSPAAAMTGTNGCTRYLAGMVGRVHGGVLSHCTNQANVSFPDNGYGSSNDAIINMGGVVASLASSSVCSYLTNTGTLTIGVKNATSNARDSRFGGVVGYLTDKSESIDHCENSGAINYTEDAAIYGDLSIGGIVGASYQAISNCTNSGPITAGGAKLRNTNYRAIAGIVGRFRSETETMTNNVNTSTGIIRNTGSSANYTLLAGLVGYGSGIISGGRNEAQIVYAGSSSHNVCIGGIVARTGQDRTGDRITGVTNSGAILVDTEGTNSVSFFIGGVVGHFQSGNMQGSNSGTVSITELTCGGVNIGGVCGYSLSNCAISSGSSNAVGGTVSVSGLTASGEVRVGGLAGNSEGTIVSGSNAANVGVANISAGGHVYAGGLAARLASAATGSNTGNVEVASTVTLSSGKLLYLGGLVGNSNGGAISASHNSGNVTNGASSDGDDLDVGGLVGNTNANISNSYNTGKVTNTGDAGVDLCMGGLVGISSNSKTFTSCYNTGDVVNSGDGNILAIGGLTGWSGTTTYTSTCYNSGAISNSGTGSESTAGVRMGGLIGFANGENDLSGGNYNQGTVTEQSSTATSYVAVGGVCGFADDASTTLASAQNKSAGTVTLSLANKTISLGRVGGVLGYASEACTLSGASNAAPIDVKTTTTSDTLYVGGLLGYGFKPCTMAGISNSGKLTIQNQSCISLYAGGLVGFNKGSITGSSSNAVGGQIAISSLSSSDASYIGGLVGYTSGSITGTSGTKIENNGSITTGGSVANHLYLGGITGYNKVALSYCTNKGAINNSIQTNVTGGQDINIGGVSGLASAALSNCSNSVAVANTSSGDSKVDICIGGVVGNNKGYTLTACSNTGSVSNAGDGGVLAVGGLAGWSGASSAYASVCYNSGAISNSGIASNSTAGVRMGGLVGCANGANNLSGTSIAYNYNGGPVTDSSESRVVNVGGVVGYINNTGSQMNYARNLADGDITIENNLRTRVGVGGIVGYAYHIFNFNYTNNAGDINFSNLTISSQVFCGGILGAFNDDSGTTKNASLTITGCVNSGQILCPNATDGGNMGAYDTSTTSFSYIGGISGVGNVYNKTFTNCSNSGNITVYNNLKTRVGGCLAYANVNPTGCSCSGNIRYYKYNNPKNGGSGQVGGVIAYINVSTVSDLTYSGSSIYTRGASGTCYTGGIVGQIGTSGSGDGNVTTFSNCKVSGTITGAGTGFNTGGPGIFAAGSNTSPWNFSFPDCVVKTGTKVTTDSAVTITADNVDTWVIGRYAPTSIAVSPTVGSWD